MAVRRKKGLPQDPFFNPDPALYEKPPVKPLFGAVVRSQTSFGRLVTVVHPPIPEGFYLVLPQDLPGNHTFTVNRSKFPLLNGETVQYLGEPLALLAGPDETSVRDLARRFRFVTAKPTLEDLVPPQLKTREIAGGTAGEEAADQDVAEVEGIYTSGTQDHGNQDPLEVFAQVNGDEIFIAVHSQWPAHVVQSVARAVDMESEKVRVKAQISSACQDSQVWFPSLAAAHAAVLAKVSGKPVHLRLSKEEEFAFSPKRPECRVLLRTRADAQGRILQMNADLVVQVGAYGVFEDEILERAMVGLLAAYRTDSYQVRAHIETSHTPPRGVVGGLGESLGLFALESHIQDLCTHLELDPAHWRQIHALRKDQVNFTGEVLKTESPVPDLIEQAARITDFSRKHASFELLKGKKTAFRNEALPLRGVGLACGFQGNGFLAGGTNPVNIEARLEAEGKLSLYIPLLTSNPRLVQLWKESAAGALQINPNDVRICPVFTGEHPPGGPSFASRAFEIVPKLIIQTCEGIAQKRFRQPLPITVRKVYRRTKGPAWDSENFTGQPFMSFTWGAAVAEVEVIPLLSEIRLKKVTLVVDAGSRIDEASARNALTEGVLTAVGWTFTENIHWDKLAVTHSSFLKYRLPGPRELPELVLHFFDSGKDRSPRGLGTLGANITAPAILSAVRQALSPEIRSIPVTRKIIDEVLRSYEAQPDPER